MARQTLLTKTILKKLPPIKATEHLSEEETIVQAKLFTPWSRWTWYVIEFDGEDTLYCLVNGFELELGYASLSELKALRGSFGLRVERDIHFKPMSLAEVRSRIEAGKHV